MRNFYVYCNRKPVEVDFSVYQAHNEMTNRAYYLAHQRGECIANRKKRAVFCDGDCHLCRFYAPKDYFSDKVETYSCAANGSAAYDRMGYSCEEIIADMARVDPDGERIGKMILAKMDQKEVAEALGIPVSTYRDRLRRIGRRLGGI